MVNDFFPSPIGCIQWAETGLCSGHGSCVQVLNGTTILIDQPSVSYSTCVCDPGWTGIGDWINMNGHDCNHKILIIQIFYILQGIFTLPLFFLCLIRLYQSFQRITNVIKENNPIPLEPIQNTHDTQIPRSTTIRTNNKRHGSDKYLQERSMGRFGTLFQKTGFCARFWNLKSVRFSLLALPLSICWMIEVILRLIQLTNEGGIPLGQSIPLTSLSIFANCLFWMFAALFVYSWMQLSLKIGHFRGHRKVNMEGSLKKFQGALLGAFALAEMTAMLCILILFYADNVYICNVIMFIYGHCHGICTSLFGVATFRTGRRIKSVLQQNSASLPRSQKNERTTVIKHVDIAIKNAAIGTFETVLVALMFSWWPWLRSLFMYHMSMSNNLMAITCTLGVYIIAPPPANRPADSSSIPTRGSRSVHSKISLSLGGPKSLRPRSTEGDRRNSHQDTTNSPDNSEKVHTDLHGEEKVDLPLSPSNPRAPITRSMPGRLNLNPRCSLPTRYSNPLPSFAEGCTEKDEEDLSEQFNRQLSTMDSFRQNGYLSPLVPPYHEVKGDEDILISDSHSRHLSKMDSFIELATASLPVNSVTTTLTSSSVAPTPRSSSGSTATLPSPINGNDEGPSNSYAEGGSSSEITLSISSAPTPREAIEVFLDRHLSLSSSPRERHSLSPSPRERNSLSPSPREAIDITLEKRSENQFVMRPSTSASPKPMVPQTEDSMEGDVGSRPLFNPFF